VQEREFSEERETEREREKERRGLVAGHGRPEVAGGSPSIEGGREREEKERLERKRHGDI